MKTVNVQTAKAQLSRLLEQVRLGEEILITRGDQPVARLVPVEPVRVERRFGAYAALGCVTDAFFEPLPDDELDAWES